MIESNLGLINEKIQSSCNRLNRNYKDVVLVCVTKERSPQEMLRAIQAGITDIGENRVQEALTKFEEIKKEASVRWHMVGHLQRNKVKQALKIFDIIHSVDSLRLASEIDKEARDLNKIIDILIQVNTSGESTKYGVKKEDTHKLVRDMAVFKNLRIRGLMTMAPFSDNPEDTRFCFSLLRRLKEKLTLEFSNFPNVKMDYLSMGMSGDWEVALEEGANMLRIGRAIFE